MENNDHHLITDIQRKNPKKSRNIEGRKIIKI